MNAKIRKVVKDIEFTEQKIIEFQGKLKELNLEKMELENVEIIGMFRGAKISTYDIAEVMAKFREFQSQDDAILDKPNEEIKTTPYLQKEEIFNEEV